MSGATARIRWHDEPSGQATGHVGTLDPAVFRIWEPEEDGGEWMLTAAALPGEAGKRRYADSPEKLKAVAERWLAEFVSSLGASFLPSEGGRKPAAKPPRAIVTPNGVCDALLEAGFALHGVGQTGFTTGRSPWSGEVTVSLAGVDLLPFNPGEGPRALLDDYARALDAAGYVTRIAVNTVIVANPKTSAPEPGESRP